MTIVHYDPNATMLAARTQYFAANQFGDDGGYGAAWVDFKLGPIPMPFPNTKERVRAVAFHDLHHILTGYDTNFLGEIEISGWELGAGCKDYVAAWALNLGGVAVWPIAPRRIFSAFVRGRRSRSLYGQNLGELLASTVAETRTRMGIPETPPTPTASDYALFAAAAAAGTVVGLMELALILPLLPIGLVTNYLKRRDEARSKAKAAAVPATVN